MTTYARPGPLPGTLPIEQPTKGDTSMSTDVHDGLPFAEEHGQRAVWLITDRDSRLHRIPGVFLGMGSSHRPEHKGHAGADHAPRGVHCSTCRWTEIRIFQAEDGTFYVVHCGASNVPGERDLVRVNSVPTSFELVEALTTVDRHTQQTVLPMPARRALAQAASHSPQARDAYINSPVT